jgi:hypothetical protein
LAGTGLPPTEQEAGRWTEQKTFRPPTCGGCAPLRRVFANAQLWTGEESFVIEDRTDEESEAFWAAVNE